MSVSPASEPSPKHSSWSNSIPPNAVVTLDNALKTANTSLIWAETQYTYTPTIGYVITGPMTLRDQIYMRPRLSDTVACNAC